MTRPVSILPEPDAARNIGLAIPVMDGMVIHTPSQIPELIWGKVTLAYFQKSGFVAGASKQLPVIPLCRRAVLPAGRSQIARSLRRYLGTRDAFPHDLSLVHYPFKGPPGCRGHMDPFRMVSLYIEESEIAGLEAFAGKVNEGSILDCVIRWWRLSDNGTLSLLPCDEPLDLQGIESGGYWTVDKDQVSCAVPAV